MNIYRGKAINETQDSPAVTMKDTVLWDMPPCRMVEMYGHFRRILWLHLSDRGSYPKNGSFQR
jgi:hypothetical protein